MKSLSVKELSWVAVKRGPRYCAPACDGGCTKAQYDKAVRDCAALCRRLGLGWKPRVWENLGWWYEAVSPDGRLKVSCVDDKSWTAFLGAAGSSGGTFAEHGDSPEEAIESVLKRAWEEIGDLWGLVNGLIAGAPQATLPRLALKWPRRRFRIGPESERAAAIRSRGKVTQ